MRDTDNESMRGVGQWSTSAAKGNYFNIMSQLSWWVHQLSFFKDQLEKMEIPQRPLSLVDAGIATGLTTCEVIGYLQQMGHTVGEVHGYDGDAISLNEARENIQLRFPHIEFFAYQGNLVTTDHFHRADGVIVSQVLQYLNAGEKGYAYHVAQNLLQSLQPNGFILGGVMLNTLNTLELITYGGEWKELLPKVLSGKLPAAFLLHNLKVIKATNPKTYPDRHIFSKVLVDGCGDQLAIESLWGINKPINGKMQYIEMGLAFAGIKTA